mgnify:FL=1
MIASFSFGCSRVDPLAGDTRRQMTKDADRKMYRYKLMYRVQQPEEGDALQRPITEQPPLQRPSVSSDLHELRDTLSVHH